MAHSSAQLDDLSLIAADSGFSFGKGIDRSMADEVRRVIDPALGERDRARLEAADSSQVRGDAPHVIPPTSSALRLLLKGGGVSLASAGVGLCARMNHEPHPSYTGEMRKAINSAYGTIAHVFLDRVPFLVLGTFALLAITTALRAAAFNAESRSIHALRRHCVLPGDLTADANALLARAQRAIQSVRDSVVHGEGLTDWQRTEAAFPEELWDLAEGLRDYSSLARLTPEKKPQHEEAALFIDEWESKLAATRRSAEARVEALEEYAAQVAAADNGSPNWRRSRNSPAGART